MTKRCFALLTLILLFAVVAISFRQQHRRPTTILRSSSVADSSASRTATKPSQPWTAIAVNALIASPLYIPIVKVARNTMVKTATSIGVEWEAKSALLAQAQVWETAVAGIVTEQRQSFEPPEYYKRAFHAYSQGNLCMDAAFEQELAGKAVGARNFPNEGLNGENFLRGCYETQLQLLGGTVLADGAVCVDMGCGTGTSTRQLAKLFPQASKVIGIDLSPPMVAVGRFLMQTVPTNASFEWVDEIAPDARIELKYGDIAHTELEASSVGFVNLCFVLHELPKQAAKEILTEAHRILRPGGTLGMRVAAYRHLAY